MKSRNLREMAEPEINALFLDLIQELFSLRLQKATGQLTNSSRLRGLRREIARINTIKTQSEK